MNINERIAARLKELRTRLGISQRQLADRLGWSQSRIGNYEAGNRSVGADDAIILAKALGVSPSELLFGDSGDLYDSLNDNQQKILKLFSQLPETEQKYMIDLCEVRLKEIDEYVEKYLKNRFKKITPEEK
ncbi:MULTISPECIES: helix-turn-helix domain-containing protein [Yersinia]|uniref:helix-turn-helix domain-containing protein n=1 Tax=Yersinia TaxID=629 RepID=UPI0005E74966|nr:helix-turn-helix domain-containing protein [Yersinia enterocolitica]EKN4799055.1 helix-turn-helix domain-containing protein [Yersinia enterocolitica]EKN5999855.1 helix-turn-helix domain-containing protein [Yersinia enterocolitica]MBW5833027.1 helix-turn-helix domain-containing protein [Yersinia enterocolitica]MBW5853166.1 helix-turn-helix domain-containing protein [Yersinia enterocolitica]MBW5879433.1 helix-turn-helix domain-containing protein [Yersinia enterocolitica]